jgi:hypothetical protein
LECDIWVINDKHRSYEDCSVKVMLQDAQGGTLKEFTRPLDLSSDSAKIVARLDWQLPAASGWRLRCELVHRGQSLSVNAYDLTVHDQLRPTPRQRLRSWITRLVAAA